jgi:hypothetical protein
MSWYEIYDPNGINHKINKREIINSHGEAGALRVVGERLISESNLVEDDPEFANTLKTEGEQFIKDAEWAKSEGYPDYNGSDKIN